MKEPDDYLLTLEGAEDFDVDLECGPDQTKWTDGKEAAKDDQ